MYDDFAEEYLAHASDGAFNAYYDRPAVLAVLGSVRAWVSWMWAVGQGYTPRSDEIEGFRLAEPGSGVRCPAREVTARHQRHLNRAKGRVPAEDGAAGLTVAGAALALGDVHRQPEHIVDRSVRQVLQVVGDVPNEKRRGVAAGWIGRPDLFSGDGELLGRFRSRQREGQVLRRVADATDHPRQISRIRGDLHRRERVPALLDRLAERVLGIGGEYHEPVIERLKGASLAGMLIGTPPLT
jgi:hypothetical protein